MTLDEATATIQQEWGEEGLRLFVLEMLGDEGRGRMAARVLELAMLVRGRAPIVSTIMAVKPVKIVNRPVAYTLE